jgi:GNAT superfamily N-acetyltransferase
LLSRIRKEQSIVFVAERREELLGFAQLYPNFSSVQAAHIWVLNDLYVAQDARRSGIARALTHAAIELARSDGAIRLELETMPDNHSARALYQATGWQRYDGTLRYHYVLTT